MTPRNRRPSPRRAQPRRSAWLSDHWHGHRRRAGMVIMEPRISDLVPGGLGRQLPSSRGRGAGAGGLDGVGAVEQRLAAQAAGDLAGFADGGPGGLVITGAEQVLGVVEQAVGEVVGGGVL